MREPTTQEVVDKAVGQIRKDMFWFFCWQALLTLLVLLLVAART